MNESKKGAFDLAQGQGYALIGQGVQTVADTIGTIVNYNQNRIARKQAQEMDTRNFNAQQEQNRFSEAMQKQNLALNKNQVEFGQRQQTAQNVTGVTSDLISKLTNTLNSNEALKNTVIGRWAA
jgi:hypothetical protein